MNKEKDFQDSSKSPTVCEGQKEKCGPIPGILWLEEAVDMTDVDILQLQKMIRKGVRDGKVFITNGGWEFIRIFQPHSSDYWGPEGTYKLNICSICGHFEYNHDDLICSWYYNQMTCTNGNGTTEGT